MTDENNRVLDNWTDSFLEYMDGTPSPEIYNKWAAYNIIAGVLERRVWTTISNCNLYPNMITMLIGGPGVGKSTAIKEVNIFWNAVKDFNVAPLNVTKEIFMNRIGCKVKMFQYNDETQIYNSLLIAADELSTLLPNHDLELLDTICNLYDCVEYFERNTVGNGLIHYDKPHVNMIISTQPSYLKELLPEAAYHRGFMSRSVMIYSENHITSLANKPIDKREKLKLQLITDLVAIKNLVGEFAWTSEAQKNVETWHYESGQNKIITHEKLQGYSTRRVIHCIKLAMVMSVSRGKEMEITLEDVEKAQVALVKAESMMPEIFS